MQKSIYFKEKTYSTVRPTLPGHLFRFPSVAGSTQSAVAEAVAPWHAAWKSEALGAVELLNLHASVQLDGSSPNMNMISPFRLKA